MASSFLVLAPEELVFRDVKLGQVIQLIDALLSAPRQHSKSFVNITHPRLHLFFMQTYTQTLRICNRLKASFELVIKPGSPDRYTITPSTLRLKGQEEGLIEIKLKVTRFAQKQKAIQQGHKDVFHIKVRADASHMTMAMLALLFPDGSAKFFLWLCV